MQGTGFLDCRLYRQQNRHILHVVNLSGFETGNAPVHEHSPVGPIEIRIPTDDASLRVMMLVSGAETEVSPSEGAARVTIDRITDHEVLVFEPT